MRLIFLTLFLFMACTTIQENKGKEKKKSSALLNFEEEKSFDLGNGLYIKNISIAATTSEENCEGIKVKLIIEPSSDAIKTLSHHGYSAFFVNISTQHNEKEIFSFHKKEQKKYGQNIEFNKAPYVALEGTHYYEEVVPFNALNLKEGPAEANFVLQVYPVKVSADSTLKKLRKLKFIGDQPIAEKSFKKSFEAPVLFKNRITVSGFNLPQNLNKKFDFALTGKGLPDLFWELKCGNEVVFSSTPIQNTLNYDVKTKTPFFISSAKDKITITIYDFDQGPFNSQDLVEEWSGTIGAISKKAPEFELVKNFKPTVETYRKN